MEPHLPGVGLSHRLDPDEPAEPLGRLPRVVHAHQHAGEGGGAVGLVLVAGLPHQFRCVVGDDLDTPLGHDLRWHPDHRETAGLLAGVGGHRAGQPHQRQGLEAVPSDALVVFLGMVGRERDEVPSRIAVELRPELPRQRRVHRGPEHLEVALVEDGALVAGAAGRGRHAGLGAGHVRHERRQGEAQLLKSPGRRVEVRDEEADMVQVHLVPLRDETAWWHHLSL